MRTISKGKKALIHVAKSQLGLSEAEYRDILESHGNGARSSRDLDPAGFASVMAHLEHLGFEPKRKFYRGAGSKELLMRKIKAIQGDLGLSDSYVDAMAQRMFGVQSHRWLDARQLHSVVAALSYHQARRSANGKNR